MANPEHVEVVERGAAAIDEWREENPDVILQLAGASLYRANFSDARLSRANLSFANLSFANLSGANLSGANLSGADLFRTNLDRANLCRAYLEGTKFNGGYVDATVFADLDLSCAQGLESITHAGPSVVGIDTLYKSRGKIPESFLRGCGVPDRLIEYLPSLMESQEAVQFYSCFISYSHKDEEFCQRLHSRMRDEHLRIWFAPEDIKAGRKIHEQIDQAIRVHDKLLIVLSEASMTSEWVETEIYRARQREKKEGKQMLFPIGLAPFEKIKEWEAFDADTGKDMAREAREYFIPDFSNWKDHDAFESAFERLLSDLRASE